MVWVISLQIKNMEFRLKSCNNQFVLSNILSVKFETANTIFNVCVPPQTIGLQIENLDITIIITSSDTTLFSIICITKHTCPAIWLNCLTFCWFKTYNWCLLSWIPDSNTSIGSSRHQFWGSIFCALSSNTINYISHFSMCLYTVFRFTILDIKYL